VQQILAEELKRARNAIVLLRFQTEIAKHFHVQLKNVFSIAPGVGAASGFERARDPSKRSVTSSSQKQQRRRSRKKPLRGRCRQRGACAPRREASFRQT